MIKLKRAYDAQEREFRRRYRLELRNKSSKLEPLVVAARSGPTTLVYTARDTEHNAAVVLRDYLAKHEDKLLEADTLPRSPRTSWAKCR